MSAVDRVGVVGCGQMGAGIAETAARAGLDVAVVDQNSEELERGRKRIVSSLDRALERSKIDESEREEALARLHFESGLDALCDRAFIFEAVAERSDVKRAVFSDLDGIVEIADVVFATNTSSIPIIEIASATARPERVLGVHFFHPVPVMDLVELTPSILTADDALERASALVGERFHKTVIRAKDRAGFIVNGLLIPYLVSAIRMFEGGFADAASIDAGMEKGCAHPMGPLRLCDFIGLDTVLGAAQAMYDEFKEPLFAPPPLLMRMVEANLLGRKTGRGFYGY